MPKMTAAEAAVRILELEGVRQTFGVPGAAINPFYAAMHPRNIISHTLARRVEGGVQMGGLGARTCSGAGRVSAALSPDALEPARPGAHRSALRRADGGD